MIAFDSVLCYYVGQLMAAPLQGTHWRLAPRADPEKPELPWAFLKVARASDSPVV
jgi:hypothetical protein